MQWASFEVGRNNFIPRRYMKSISCRSCNCFYLCIIWDKKRIEHFQNQSTTVTFCSLENVLCPEGQRGMVSLFFGNHICPPSFLSGGWFYGFFSLGIFTKKNHELNLISFPKLGKIHTGLGLNQYVLPHGFF